MGAGKSYTGDKLAKLLGISFYDLDEFIEKQEDKSISEIFKTSGEQYFRKLEEKYLKQLIKENNDAVISTGGGTPCFFENAETMLNKGLVIYLQADENVLFKRIKNSTHRPLIRQKSKDEILKFIQQKVKERTPHYKKAHFIYHQSAAIQDTAKEIYQMFSF